MGVNDRVVDVARFTGDCVEGEEAVGNVDARGCEGVRERVDGWPG